MSFLGSVADHWMPPAIASALRRISRHGNRFEGSYSSWDEAARHCVGYHDPAILDKVLASTLKVVRDEAAFERDSIAFAKPEYVWPTVAGLMWAAARSGGRLDVLDFGGSLGSSFFQYRHWLGEIAELRWSIVEQPHYVRAGKQFIQDKRLGFYESMEECLQTTRPNAVLLSSSLQYLREPRKVFDTLSRIGATVLIIAKTPFSSLPDDVLTIQNVPATIYSASYPMWIFSESGFIQQAGDNWELIAAFPATEGQTRTTSGVRFGFSGMIFGAKHGGDS